MGSIAKRLARALRRTAWDATKRRVYGEETTCGHGDQRLGEQSHAGYQLATGEKDSLVSVEPVPWRAVVGAGLHRAIRHLSGLEGRCASAREERERWAAI